MSESESGTGEPSSPSIGGMKSSGMCSSSSRSTSTSDRLSSLSALIGCVGVESMSKLRLVNISTSVADCS